MTTNADVVSEPIQHTAESVADSALKIVQLWRDNDDVPSRLVTEIEALVVSVRSQATIKTDVIHPAHIELVAEWLFERYSDEPEWETWAELVGSLTRSSRASSIIAEWRTKAKGTIRDPMPAAPVNPPRSFDSAIEDLAKVIVVAAATYSNYDHYFDSSSVVANHLTQTVTAWSHQWSVPDELKAQMIRIVVKRVDAPEMKARLDNGLSTPLNSILRDRILNYSIQMSLREHNIRRSNAETTEAGK